MSRISSRNAHRYIVFFMQQEPNGPMLYVGNLESFTFFQ